MPRKQHWRRSTRSPFGGEILPKEDVDRLNTRIRAAEAVQAQAADQALTHIEDELWSDETVK